MKHLKSTILLLVIFNIQTTFANSKLDQGLYSSTKNQCDVNVVELLLEKGANPNSFHLPIGKSSKSSLETPLMNTIHRLSMKWEMGNNKEKCLDVLELLLKHNANINLQNPIGKSGMHSFYLSTNNIELFNYLVKKGGNPNIKRTVDSSFKEFNNIYNGSSVYNPTV